MFKTGLRSLKAAITLAALLLVTSCTQEDISWYSGTIEAEETEVVSQVSGQLLEVLVEEGEVLGPDQVVAIVDAEPSRLQVKQAEAVIASLKAQLRDLKAGNRKEQIRQAEADLKAAEAALHGAEQDLSYKEDNLTRVKRLVSEGAINQQQLEQAQAQVDTAESLRQQAAAQYEAAQARLRLLREGATSNAVKALEAKIRQAEAARDLAQLQVDRSSVRTISGGTVVSLNAQPGEMVNPGTSVVTVADLSDLWVKIYIPETHLNLVSLGDKVRIKVDSYPNRDFIGQVVNIASKAEFTPKNVQTKEERVDTVFAVKVKVLEGWDELKPGMPADVYLHPVEE